MDEKSPTPPPYTTARTQVSTELNWPADKKNRDREDAEKIETLDRALGLHDG